MTAKDGRRIVRCYSQDGEDHSDFDVSVLTIPAALREAMIAALVARTAPGTRLTSHHSFEKSYRALKLFDGYLAGLASVPQSPAELTPAHYDGFNDDRRTKGIKTARAELARATAATGPNKGHQRFPRGPARRASPVPAGEPALAQLQQGRAEEDRRGCEDELAFGERAHPRQPAVAGSVPRRGPRRQHRS